ncbi:TetR/AcrR family transcriptional regulator [Occultella gossypii]|uniref:TetR/AcrR family transcriptional regulator n=1 Tax=Occultella gossypii TaxID=2800820 RepID=A0ABS7SCC2_9MICO|nr:TetR/AcrR family transcriptional regulator [Occultella gossypii]MBZ2197533.1 TetR/AcrR family transcriptional regulator [Occultella gossypii]
MTGYHHGDLPRQLLADAAEMAAELGPEAITLRELARRSGVSHSAPVHHFGTRQGLLTALAVEGFQALNDALSTQQDDIHEMGVAYVTWALEHPGHYAVMWQPRLLSGSSEDLVLAREQAWTLLSTTVAEGAPADRGSQEIEMDAHAAFAIVHGLVGLWLSAALPYPEDPTVRARQVVRRLGLDRP